MLIHGICYANVTSPEVLPHSNLLDEKRHADKDQSGEVWNEKGTAAIIICKGWEAPNIACQSLQQLQ
jgi:hypothetical protein